MHVVDVSCILYHCVALYGIVCRIMQGALNVEKYDMHLSRGANN